MVGYVTLHYIVSGHVTFCYDMLCYVTFRFVLNFCLLSLTLQNSDVKLPEWPFNCATVDKCSPLTPSTMTIRARLQDKVLLLKKKIVLEITPILSTYFVYILFLFISFFSKISTFVICRNFFVNVHHPSSFLFTFLQKLFFSCIVIIISIYYISFFCKIPNLF